MSKALTARDILAPKDFNPMELDLTEIKELSDSIPSNGEVDINQAEILAAKSLRVADLCSDILSIATCYVAKCDTEKKKCYAQAALVKSSAAGIKTDKSKAWYAESDQDFIDASNKYSEALALVKWITSKHESAVRFHYLCKQMLSRNYSSEKAAGFISNTDKIIESEQPATEEDNFGKEW